jgi:hypothetical protein
MFGEDKMDMLYECTSSPNEKKTWDVNECDDNTSIKHFCEYFLKCKI